MQNEYLFISTNKAMLIHKINPKQMTNEAQEPIPAWMKTLCDSEAKKEGYIV